MAKRNYDHQAIENKWRKKWEDEKVFEVNTESAENKFYCLDMFPYPSGDGLHVGHWRGYVLNDFYARYQRLMGKEVLHPMGFDAFGLPAENAAIKNQSHPKVFTDSAIEKFTEQLKQTGASYDWSKLIKTSDPNYYKWTQWLFLQMFDKGLAEKKESLVNWCPNDQTVLANEQVVDGKCERCGTKVVKKQIAQWFLKTTEFADVLLNDLDKLDWPEHVKTLQKNWIGKSEGARVVFGSDSGDIVEVFTTRLDTIFGVTAIVLAPEHHLADKLVTNDNKSQVDAYKEELASKSDIERQQEKETEKTAVFTGSFAVHPLTNSKVPIWIADYVLLNYGTGAVMSVPAHDERDFLFAKTHNLPIFEVVKSGSNAIMPFAGYGNLENSGEFNGLSSDEAINDITEKLEKDNKGNKTTNYRLRDWLVSRQRYWGAPIPIVYDPEGNPHAIKEEHLPLELPTDVDFTPGGESPIARSNEYKAKAEELYGKGWYFDTDTLDTFVDSSWYYLRYLTPNDESQPFDKDLVAKWLPVDLYIGGIEHATGHLMYSRFVAKFLAKYGYIDEKCNEPFKKLFNIGMINLHGTKMSKSKGNVVSPDPLIEHYGTDALRGYEMFVGPLDVEAEWNPKGINGVHRFLIKTNNLLDQVTDEEDLNLDKAFDEYLKNINGMIDNFRINTVISEYMKLVNKFGEKLPRSIFEKFVITLSPTFPFITEELWSELGHTDSVFKQAWPVTDEGEQEQTVPILVNQKYQTEIAIPSHIDETSVVDFIEKNTDIVLSDKLVKSVVYKAGKVVNIIVS